MAGRTLLIPLAAASLALGGCSGSLGSVAVFKPAAVQPPPSERNSVPATGTAADPDAASQARPERRLTLPSR